MRALIGPLILLGGLWAALSSLAEECAGPRRPHRLAWHTVWAFALATLAAHALLAMP